MTIEALWAGMRAIFKGNIADFGMDWLFPSFFAFVFLFAPKASIWVKDEVSMSSPVKIDNIPIGIAFFSSISSGISYSLSEMLEKHLLPPDSGLASRKTGIMFGAKAAGKIRDIQIQNPITLRNTKEYMRQCFTKPYIIGDILGKKGAAQVADDIMDFLEKNPPNNFGIYYRDPESSITSFKTCKQATPLIKLALSKELHDGLLTKFAASIGLQSDQLEQLKTRLKVMTNDTLKYLKKDQTDIYTWMKQAMLLNANRESYDDWREKYSLNRIYPELVAMSATRGMFQQSFGWLTAGEMAANMMPVLQSAFFAVIVCLIFMVFPMSLLPGGIGILKTWIVLMIWVNSWPVFFTIIHCLGMISLAGKQAGLGGGMNILSQGGFSEVTLNSYATYQMFAASVPMLAYAVLKGCTHATTALAGAFAPSSTAVSIGSNMADNNLNIDTISHGGRNIGQEQYAASLHMGGGVIDDGGMRVVSPDFGGGQIVTQPIDSLPTNYRASQMYSDSLQTQLTDTQSKIGALTNRSAELTSAENRQMLDLAHKIARGEASIEGMSVSEQESLRETLSQGFTSSKGNSSKTTMDTATNTSASVGFKIAGTGASTGVSSSNSESISREMSTSEQRAYNAAMEKVKNAAKTNSITGTSDDVKSLTTGLSQTMSEQQSIGREIARTAQTMQSLQSQKSYVAQNSATIDRNVNDAVLQRIIDTHPEITSKEQAARWMMSHPVETDQLAKQVMSIDNPLPNKNWDKVTAAIKGRELSNIDSYINNTAIKTTEQLKTEAAESTEKLRNQATVKDATGGEISLSQKVENDLHFAKQSYNKDTRHVLNDNLSVGEKIIVQDIQTVPLKVVKDQVDLEHKFNDTSDSTIIRVGEKIGDNTGLGDKAIKAKNIYLPK
ncbi:conjugal transfer protein TraG N-terminal domain-containing protein [Candidatus Tisiphia endosymbiont of Nemotelus nigrinus]